jgi:hypothetical protein
VTPERFAQGMTFTEYLDFVGTPQNLAREGFDIRRWGLVRPRLDWSGYVRERYARARLTEPEAAAIRWLAARPGGPARVLVIAEDWSSDCRRDLPYLARLAEARGRQREYRQEETSPGPHGEPPSMDTVGFGKAGRPGDRLIDAVACP